LQAIRAGAERNRIAEAFHLLKAKKWNQSHSVVMQHIAPDAVVNGMDSSRYTVFTFCWSLAQGKPADSAW